MNDFKPDEISEKIITGLKDSKLKEIGVFTALADLTERSKSCLLSELHLIAYNALTGQFTLYEACLKMEDIAKNKVLPVADKLEKKVNDAYKTLKKITQHIHAFGADIDLVEELRTKGNIQLGRPAEKITN